MNTSYCPPRGDCDAATAACLVRHQAPRVAQEVITVGAAATTSDAPIYIADRLGYFREEGLTVKVTNFRSAADMVPVLGTGALDAGAGSASAGLYNATVQGINIKIVADKASSPPGYGATKILIRADHIESGRFKTLADLKGFRFAMNAPGVSNTATLNALLKSAGLRYSDVTTVNMPLPEHVAALGNKAVDAVGLGRAGRRPSPSATSSRVLLKSRRRDHPEPPDRGAALFGEIRQEHATPATASCAPISARVRFYNGALQDGRLAGPERRQGDRDPRRVDADQGPRDLQGDHADRHEPGRPRQHRRASPTISRSIASRSWSPARSIWSSWSITRSSTRR